MATVASQMQALTDRLAVCDVPITYAKGIDTRDWDLVRSCFTAQARIAGSRSEGSADEYLVRLRPGVEIFPTTMHFMGNQLTSVDGDRARVETYCVAYHWMAEQAGAPDEANLVVGVRYHDELVRTAEGWKIAARRVSPDWRQGPYPVEGG
jgi:hypothetical protein